MKKTFAIALVFVMLFACVPFAVSAKTAPTSDLPFELIAPGYCSADRGAYENGHYELDGDSPTTTQFTYSLSNDMTTFFKNMNEASLHDEYAEFMSKYTYDEIWMSVQIDWAIDDVNDSVSGWHYNEYWDGDEYYGLGKDSEGNYRYGEWDIVDGWLGNAEETVQETWITRGVPWDWAWNGNPETHTPGLKDQMRSNQYTYVVNDDDEGVLTIDYSKHTVYFRARFVVTLRTEGADHDEWRFSEWSNVASFGKDAPKLEPMKQSDLITPVITSLRMTDKEFNGNPIVAYTLTVPDTFMEKITKVQAIGGDVRVEVEARVKGDIAFTGLQGDWIVRGGEMEADLFSLVNETRPNIPKDTIIELRVRYSYDHSRFFDGTMYSDYSKIISFGTDDISIGGEHGEYTIKFLNWDSSVISEKKYDKGENVIIPQNPTRPDDDKYTYAFTGWDKKVVNPANGNATYVAQYEAKPKPALGYVPGDVNGNGKIDAGDYAMAKRSVLNTYVLTEEQNMRGDINKNGKVDATDYAKIKRHFLKTYVIPGAEGK